MKTRIIIPLLLCVASLSAYAQDIYNLDKCKQLALENNAKVKNSWLGVEAARQTSKEAFTHYFPSVSAMGGGFKASKPMLEMGLDLSPLNPAFPPMSMNLMKDGMVGGIMATQPIFAGGQIVNANKLAKLGVSVSQYKKQMTDDEVLLKTEEYYWQLISLKEKIKTLSRIEAMLDNVHKDVKGATDAGITNRNDLLKVELKQNELAMGRLKLENGTKLLKMTLGQQIGVSPYSFDVDTAAQHNLLSPADVFTSHGDALVQRAEYQLLEKGVEASQLQKKLAVGKNLPTVAVGAGYNYYGIDHGGMDNNFGVVFATVSIPLSGWWGGSHDIKKQNLNIQMAENTKQEASEMLLIQMQQLWNELDEAYHQMELAKQSIAVADENVRLNADYYKAGTTVLTDLLNAQTALQQVSDQYTEAVTNYQMKLSRYLQATGRNTL